MSIIPSSWVNLPSAWSLNFATTNNNSTAFLLFFLDDPLTEGKTCYEYKTDLEMLHLGYLRTAKAVRKI